MLVIMRIKNINVQRKVENKYIKIINNKNIGKHRKT
jgi:hypothetical protein